MEQEHLQQEASISLVDLYNVIKNWFWFLAAISIIGGLILGVYAFYIAKPKYQSTGSVMVQHFDNDQKVNMTQSLNLVQFTMDILNEYEEIHERTALALNGLGYNVDYLNVRKNMSVSNAKGSLLVQVKYTSEDPKLSKYATSLLIDNLLSLSNDNTSNISAPLVDSLSFFNISDSKYVSPNKLLLVVGGVIMGGSIGLVIVFSVEFSKKGYKTKEELERELNIQVLGEVPMFKIK